MQRNVGAIVFLSLLFAPVPPAAAQGLPDILTGPNNVVPECVTPGRLMQYVKQRNRELDQRYDGIATEYMRLGEQLGLRWDFAFYQMIVETGALSYKRGNRAGDVKPQQNNFAGLGATGKGEHGESFKDIAAGVQAHLEHLLLYAGRPVESPIAERTRKVREWGVLTGWQQALNRPVTFADLASKWAPGSTSYRKMLDAVAERFIEDVCDEADPRPELVQLARAANKTAAEEKAERPSGSELARRAIDEAKTEGNRQRSALGATTTEAAAKSSVPYKVLNAAPGTEAQAATGEHPLEALAKASQAYVDAKAKGAPAVSKAPDRPVVVASAAAGAKALAEPGRPPAAGAKQKCRVWTASYGGQKAMIIRSMIDQVINYTVLDVNEGAETREAEAFIAAYAKEGKIVDRFVSQGQALDKAFELCPED